jgi:methionyl aminopeptidase
MVSIKSKAELDYMRASGRLVASILQTLAETVKPGVTLLELNDLSEELTLKGGAKPAFKGYLGYQHTLCTSVNEQVVHGIPTKRKLEEGDIVGLDFGLVMDGFYSDSAVTVPVGKVSAEAKQLMKATQDSLYAAIAAARAGNTLKDIARAVESTVKPYNYGVVREFVGHGIGRKLHEEPQVANYEAGATGFKLKPGMCIAIEPMINAGTAEVKVLKDKWTVVTLDGAMSAHFEHSIIITEGDAEILTDWSQGKYRQLTNS